MIPDPAPIAPPSGLAAALLRSGRVAVLAVDALGVVRYANPAACRLAGRDDARQRPVGDVLPDWGGEPWPAWFAALGADRVDTRIATLRHRDGRSLRVEIDATRIASEAEPLAMLCLRDVSTRLATERELEASQALKAAVLDAALDAVVVMDDAGRVLDVNAVALRIFGWTREAMIGASVAERLIPPEHRDAHHAGMQRYLATGVSHVLGRRLELEALSADGSRIPVEVAIQAITIDGRPVFTAYLRDIRARREAQRQLVAARDAAERASTAKSRFLAGFSHEIRTPMTAIVGYADLLSRGEADPERREAWRRAIRQNADHLLALIDDILDVSQIEAGRLALHPADHDVARLIDDALAPFRARAAERGVALRLRLAPELAPRLCLDGTRLRQIVVNLVTNALRCTERGSIDVEVGHAEGRTDRLRLAVVDTGRGIAPEQLAELFEPFVRYAPSRDGGAGMGLAIVRLLARCMGGDVGVRSAPGAGATFIVEIDCAPATGATATEPYVDLPNLAGRRLLIVDDNADNRDILCHLLEDAGAVCERAVDGVRGAEAAIAATGSGAPYDAVLMDLQMPALDGYGALAALRAAGCRSPVLAVTAYATNDDRARCAAAGFDGFLTKPVVGFELLRAVAALPGFAVAAPPPRRTPLRSTMADDPRFRELLQRYLDRIGETRDELARLRAAGDTDGVSRLAHRIKGTAGSYGYAEITTAAARCETPLRGGARLEDVAAALDRLDELLAMALAGREAGDAR